VNKEKLSKLKEINKEMQDFHNQYLFQIKTTQLEEEIERNIRDNIDKITEVVGGSHTVSVERECYDVNIVLTKKYVTTDLRTSGKYE